MLHFALGRNWGRNTCVIAGDIIVAAPALQRRYVQIDEIAVPSLGQGCIDITVLDCLVD